MILLALGSNRGNREEFLSQARTVLMAYDIHILAQSSIHETPALMPEGAPADWDMPEEKLLKLADEALVPAPAATPKASDSQTLTPDDVAKLLNE